MPGLDKSVLNSIVWELAIRRIRVDFQTDFILASHFNAIFLKAAAGAIA